MKVYILWDIRKQYLVGAFATMELAEANCAKLAKALGNATMDYTIWEEEIQGF